MHICTKSVQIDTGQPTKNHPTAEHTRSGECAYMAYQVPCHIHFMVHNGKERTATKHWKVMAMQCMYYTLEEKHTRKMWARVWVSECHRTIERYLHTQYRKKIKPNPIRLNSKEKTEETKTECHSPNGISQSKQVAAKHPADAPLILSSSKCGAYFLKHTATPTW